VALTRAPRVCGEPGCVGVPVFNGRCRVHARWPSGNEARNGWVCGSTDLIELHHLKGVEDNRPEALELRCRKHNPRGAPTHKR
jgi:hypothetical protein